MKQKGQNNCKDQTLELAERGPSVMLVASGQYDGLSLDKQPSNASSGAGLPPRICYSTGHAAQLLDLSPRTLERWRVQGKGPRFRKLGSRVTYTLEDLISWANANLRSSTSDPGNGMA